MFFDDVAAVVDYYSRQFRSHGGRVCRDTAVVGLEHASGAWHIRAGDTSMRAHITERVQPGVVYTTFHHPESGANVITTDYSDWATNCPEYKVTAVEVRLTNRESRWQEDYEQLQKRQRIETALTSAEADLPEFELAIGPEGGWTGDEIALFAKHNWQPASLGPRILRARRSASSESAPLRDGYAPETTSNSRLRRLSA